MDVLTPWIIPIFIPNKGCPHRCIFCNQKNITGVETKTPDTEIVRETINNALTHYNPLTKRPAEVAFYGGSFTLLDQKYQAELLSTCLSFIKSGLISGIRISTRPDGIDNKILDFLKSYGVYMIELGAQSMDNLVLKLAGRGHRAEDTQKASFLIHKSGIKLGIQIMPGLPGEDIQSFRDTISETVLIKPETIRIYPAIVIKNTAMADQFQNGDYTPLNIDDAIDMCEEAVLTFERHKIKVIRVGLQTSLSLESPGMIKAGPFHPAFGQLVQSKIFSGKISLNLKNRKPFNSANIIIHPDNQSLLTGFKNAGIKKIEAMFPESIITVKLNTDLKKGTHKIEITNTKTQATNNIQ